MAERKYFGTDGVRGRVGEEPITAEFMLKLGWATGKVLGCGGRDLVVIGKDTRISGYMFESALEAGLVAAGVDVKLLGPMPTPAVALMTQKQAADADSYKSLFDPAKYAETIANIFGFGNTSAFPGLPWQGFTLDWFFADSEQRSGVFHDERNQKALWVSLQTALAVSLLPAIAVGWFAAGRMLGTVDNALADVEAADEQRERRLQEIVHELRTPLAVMGTNLELAATQPDTDNFIEAALRAARFNKMKVDMADFEFAKDKVMMGSERRSLVMSEEEKRLTAYHEAGHALVAVLVPEADPLHKVTIIPRGRAGGYTMALPLEDKHYEKRSELVDQLAMLLGGRTAEELRFTDPSTGASNDIEKATGVARAMVTQYGMTERLGAIKFGQERGEPFLGREIGEIGILLFLAGEQVARRDAAIDTGLQGIGVGFLMRGECCTAQKHLGQYRSKNNLFHRTPPCLFGFW